MAKPPKHPTSSTASGSKDRSSSSLEVGGDGMLNSRREFDRVLASRAKGEGDAFVLRLFVAGSASRSAQAIGAIRSACEEHLAGRYELEVIDIYQQPAAAVAAQIVAAPTLVREFPRPLKRMIGDLGDRARILSGLDLPPAGEGGQAP